MQTLTTVLSCGIYEFNYVPKLEESAMIWRTTEKGVNNYGRVMTSLLVQRLNGLVILQEFSADVLSYRFVFSKLKIADIEIDDIQGMLGKNPQFAVHFAVSYGELVFEFQLIQQIYPYFEDIGTGNFKLSAELLLTGETFLSKECNFSLNIEPFMTQLRIGLFRIEIVSENSFLYNSISQLLAKVVKGILEKLVDEIMKPLFQDVNRQQDQEFRGILNGDFPFGNDFRYLNAFAINSSVAEINYPGYFCKRNNEAMQCSGKYFEGVVDQSKRPSFAQSNYDHQLYVNYKVLDSMYWMLFEEYSKEIAVEDLTFVLLDRIRVDKFTKTGAILNFSLRLEEIDYHFQVFAEIQLLPDPNNADVLYISLKFKHAIDENIPQIDFFLSGLQELYKEFRIIYTAQYCQKNHFIQFVNDEWFVANCNFEE